MYYLILPPLKFTQLRPCAAIGTRYAEGMTYNLYAREEVGERYSRI